MRLVFKFGGTSLGDGERIRNACNIVRTYHRRGDKIVVVCSAMGDTTDILLELMESAARGERGKLDDGLERLRSAHIAAVEYAVDGDGLRNEALTVIEKRLNDLTYILSSIYFLREVTPRSRDLVLSFGERLSTWTFTCTLRGLGIAAKYLEGGDAGIITDSDFGYATPLMEETLNNIKNTILPLLSQGVVPVVTGFIGRTRDGAITTLGRGGSDFTATLLGSGIKADEVVLWSDVDGLLTADPKIVRDAKVIPQLSYEEALEMAVFGAKGLHPRAIEAAQNGGVKIRIKNTFNPSAPGTLITDRSLSTDSIVKGVLLVRDVAMITVKGASAVGKPGSAARILQSISSRGINVMMISQSVSESSISLIVRRESADLALEAIRESSPPGVIRGIECEKDVVVVAVVGEGMKGTPGVASRVFGAVARRGVNVRMIAQGSSELNISFVVKEADGVEAVRAIHEDYGLG
ncbi:Aspartokinase [Candidatus Calditenuaceae archaeon HR02]|nr:Aspartokinase [Candidatus Calditenuaceae archaeon HR02]